MLSTTPQARAQVRGRDERGGALTGREGAVAVGQLRVRAVVGGACATSGRGHNVTCGHNVNVAANTSLFITLHVLECVLWCIMHPHATLPAVSPHVRCMWGRAGRWRAVAGLRKQRAGASVEAEPAHPSCRRVGHTMSCASPWSILEHIETWRVDGGGEGGVGPPRGRRAGGLRHTEDVPIRRPPPLPKLLPHKQ